MTIQYIRCHLASLCLFGVGFDGFRFLVFKFLKTNSQIKFACNYLWASLIAHGIDVCVLKVRFPNPLLLFKSVGNLTRCHISRESWLSEFLPKKISICTAKEYFPTNAKETSGGPHNQRTDGNYTSPAAVFVINLIAWWTNNKSVFWHKLLPYLKRFVFCDFVNPKYNSKRRKIAKVAASSLVSKLHNQTQYQTL